MEEKDLENTEKTVEESTKKQRSSTKKKSTLLDNIISLVILIVCTVGLIYSGKQLFTWVMNNIKSNSVINEVTDIAGVPDIGKDENPGAEFGINFERLLAANPDVIAWIRIPGTSVNYSLVQTDNNSQYLRHSFNGAWNEFGWPFVDCSNAPDFSDKNTVLYGHNIVSGLMFADLANIAYGYMGSDVEIDIYRKDYRLLTYKVFSAYEIDPESFYLTKTFLSDESYSTFLNTMTSRSLITYNQTVGVDDTIITLQTCTSDAKRRIIVHAKLVSNTEMPR